MSNECIIKGFIIPRRGEDGKLQYVKEFTKEEMNYLYNLYKEFICVYRDTYLKINKSNGKLSSIDDINDFLNGLIFYIKSLLNIDPIPSDLSFIKETALPSPTTLLRSFIINSSYKELDNLFKKEDGKLLFELSPENIEILERIMSKIEEHNDVLRMLKDIAIKLVISKDNKPTIFDFPADTRVGSNTSSLIIHMLTTSSIAASLYLEREKPYNSKVLQILRLTSIFHDIAKMYDWHKHQTKSSELLLDIFRDYVAGDAAEIINDAAEIIKTYDENSLRSTRLRELYRIFNEADRLASSRDILLELIDKLLPDEYKQVISTKRKLYEDKGYTEPFDRWEFWAEFSYDEIKRFTEAFCRNASSIVKDNPAFMLTENGSKVDEKKIDDVSVIRLDFSSIQSYIESNDIRVMNGASRLVDLIIFVFVPYYITKYMGLPPENILYYGGGNCTLLIPKSKTREIEKLVGCFKNDNITLNHGSSLLYSNFATTNYFIDKDLTCKKLVRAEGRIDPNIHKRCISCNKNSIKVTEDNLHEKEKDMCEECKKKFRIGNIYHFKSRLRSIGIDEDTEKVLNKVLEYISGHELNKLDNIEKYKDLAFIKFDGNLLGQLMASSISLTDAHERSFRIDYSVKKAFHDFLYKLQTNNLHEYAKRIVMGLMYMGGDDGVLLIPSTVSIPFALHMIHEYNLNMGKKSTLSIGIAVGKPKHPIQLLKDGARYLLDDVTKDEVRANAYEIHKSNKPEDIRFEGGLSFFVADSGNISDKALESIFNNIRDRERLSMQPYVIDNTSNNSINKLLNILQLNSTNIDNIVDELLIRLNDNNFKEGLKKIRNLCLKNLYININGSSELKLRVIYGKKESQNSTMAMIVNNLLVGSNNGIYFALYDLYQLLKVMGVEHD